MANENIPESITFAEAQAIQRDESHPLRDAYKRGDERLVAAIDRAYMARYGGQEDRQSSGDEEISREHAELKQKFQSAVDPDEIPPEISAAIEAGQELGRQEWGDDCEGKQQEAVDYALALCGGDEQRFAQMFVDWGLHRSGEKQIEAAKFLLKLKSMK